MPGTKKIYMEFKAQNIADFLGGTVEGDANVSVSDVAKIEEGRPGTEVHPGPARYGRPDSSYNRQRAQHDKQKDRPDVIRYGH